MLDFLLPMTCASLAKLAIPASQDQDTGVLVEGCPAVETAVWGLLMSTHPSIKPTPSQALATKVASDESDSVPSHSRNRLATSTCNRSGALPSAESLD